MTTSDRLKSWEGLLLAVLVAIVIMNVLRSPYYLGVGNIVNLFQLSIEKIIVALIMTLIIINGEIDLSVASVMGLAACVLAWLFQLGAPMPVAIGAALLSGLIAGLFNGFWIAYVGLPSLAVTLAGLIGYRGVARIFVEDRAIGGFPSLVQYNRPAAGARSNHRFHRHFRGALHHRRDHLARIGIRPARLLHRQQR